MLNSQDLQYHVYSLQQQEQRLASLAFCFNVYVDFLNGREASEHMDLTKATDQLVNAVARMLQQPSPFPLEA